MDKYERINTYHKAYLDDYDFEQVQVRQRQNLVLQVLSDVVPDTVIEISCGADLLYSRSVEESCPISKWIIIEPNLRFATHAEDSAHASIELHVIRKFFEDAGEDISKVQDGPVDIVICSGMLNDVQAPEAILAAARTWMSEKSILHINAPNAGSFHRRLAVAMGIIPDVKVFSERNRELQQYSVYDMKTMTQLLENNGFIVESTGGYFIKPFTHKQMAAIKDVLSNKVLDGLWKMGVDYPELASEFYINATLKI